DYYLPNLDRKEQQDYFERQLAMAKAADMPVVIHARKSHDDIITLLEKLRVPCGTIHAFNGSLQQAQKYIDLGFKLGFGGTLTFERSSKIRALAKALPLDSIVLETDAPDMTVSQHQGERNSPEYLPYCFQALSEIRDESPEEIATQLFKNSCEVFRIQGLVS
ncbi:MAG: TatD family hydrolase, partial [Gammaproteobacteria bacterium]|nr:TatD family hydrolase [Gammaproteobacteria bacterium]